MEDLLKELLAYARRYEILLGAPISGQSTGAVDSYSGKTCRVLDACIYRLNRLEDFGTGEDKDLTGRLIARFSYKNMEQPVASWVEMFRKVLQILYAEDRSIITKPACSDGNNVAWHFSMDASAYIKSVEIGDGIYVRTNTSTQSKLSVLARVFRLYEAEPADLVFYLRDENEPAGDKKLPRRSSGAGSTQRYSTGITRSLPFSVTSLS